MIPMIYELSRSARMLTDEGTSRPCRSERPLQLQASDRHDPAPSGAASHHLFDPHVGNLLRAATIVSSGGVIATAASIGILNRISLRTVTDPSARRCSISIGQRDSSDPAG